MKERDIVTAGLKIVGFFILVQGAVNLFFDGISFVAQYNCIPEMVSAMIQPMEMSEAETLSMTENVKGISMIPIAGQLIKNVFKIIFGLYLCRDGKLITKLLTRSKES